MYCTDVTHVVDLWAWLIQLDMQHLLHGCANFWLGHWLVSTIFHCSSPPLRFVSTFHPPLSRPNSRTFWPRWNTICWLISQAIASHALIFTSRRTASYQLSWEVNWEANWTKGKGHFRALWGKDVSTMTLHLITFCQLVANTTSQALREECSCAVARMAAATVTIVIFVTFAPHRLWKIAAWLMRTFSWKSRAYANRMSYVVFAKVQDLGKMKSIWLMFFI